MKAKIIDFWESRVIDSEFIIGVIIGLVFNIIIIAAVQMQVISWTIGTISMTIILSLGTLMIAPTVNIGFIVGLYLLTFCFDPKENINFLIIFIVFLFLNFFSYKKTKPDEKKNYFGKTR